MSGSFDTRYHSDGTVTLWNVYEQRWERGSLFADNVWASLSNEERRKIHQHFVTHSASDPEQYAVKNVGSGEMLTEWTTDRDEANRWAAEAEADESEPVVSVVTKSHNL
jgi:hypothetical protein